jgi:transposase
MKAGDLEPQNETLEQQNERLKRELLERDSKIYEQIALREAKIDELLAERDATIQKLKDEVFALRRRLFGRSSERFIPEDPSQLSIAFDGLESLPEELEAQAQEIEVSYTRKKENKKQPVRNAIPEHLRREVIVIEPENIPDGSVRIGEEITEKLGYIPGEVYVIHTIRPKYALPQGGGIKIADLPSQVLPRSNAGASLLAHLLVSKYQDHLPFYRQLEIFKRQKIILAASTVNGWFCDSVDLLRLLYETLKKEVLSSDYIQIDESTIPVMDKDHPGSTRKGYHWIVKSPVQNQLFFHYQQGSRAQKVVVELLHPFQGAVQSDAYGAYDIYENKKGVLLLGCMAHARSYQYL